MFNQIYVRRSSSRAISFKNAMVVVLLVSLGNISKGQTPEILLPQTQDVHYLPDFSYAGFKNGESGQRFLNYAQTLNVGDFGAIPDDGLDDSKALIQALETADQYQGGVIIQFAPGQYILSEILYVKRSNVVLRGTGSGSNGTTIHCPRPMKYLKAPESLKELREYLIKFDKRQREKHNNIDLPFSQYSWAGGMIWVRKDGTRVKSYLPDYAVEGKPLTLVSRGKKGALTCSVISANSLTVGDVVQIEWFNKSGEMGSLLDELYKTREVKIGSHHWKYPDEPLVKQQVKIEAIDGLEVTFSSPLLLDAKAEWHTRISKWHHLENVGIEHLRISFPMAETIAHHVEEGFNAIYLTRLFNGWVKDVKIVNSDSGILTEEVANVTIQDVETRGEKLAHYAVYIGGVHNVLVENLKVYNKVRHPLSFNTFSTKSVFKNCEVFVDPILDQHSGANHQNLFDDVKLHVRLKGEDTYPLFAGGGAGYWKPSHGAYNTFWNVQIHFLDGVSYDRKILLNGMNDGSTAILVGVHANMPVEVEYGPNAHIELTNRSLSGCPSLYDYQLQQRLKK